MSIFDLIFLCGVLASVMLVPAIGIAAARGKRRAALKMLRLWGSCVAVYLTIVVAAALALPVRTLAVGDTQCSDDWCISVAAVRRVPQANGLIYSIDFRLDSRAGRVSQREKGVIVYLVGEQGVRHNPLPDPNAVPFDVLLLPGQSLTTTRRFAIPEHAGRLSLVIAKEGLQVTWLIIGRSPFDGRTVVRID